MEEQKVKIMTILEQIEDTIFNLHYWEHYRKMAQIRHCKKFVEIADKNIAKLKEELKELKERREQYGGNRQ